MRNTTNSDALTQYIEDGIDTSKQSLILLVADLVVASLIIVMDRHARARTSRPQTASQRVADAPGTYKHTPITCGTLAGISNGDGTP